MSVINYRNLSLSELSFLIINKTESSLEQNRAYEEIKRRFSRNGCNYKIFMEYEEEAIEERGNEISNYLIYRNTNIQKLMEIYFNYVCNSSIFTHGNLLFSEVMLCNENSKRDFFSKVIRKELERIKQKINLGNISREEMDNLQFISNFLDNRINKEIPFWQENNIVNAVEDISNFEFFTSEKTLKKYENKSNHMREINNEVLKILYVIPTMVKASILDIDVLNFIAMEIFAKNDIARLSNQKRSIKESMKKDYDIDYSFINKQKILRLSKEFKDF